MHILVLHRKVKLLYFAFFLLLPTTTLHAQAYLSYDYQNYIYHKETSIGVNFNTLGGLLGGVMFKHAFAITPRWFHNIYVTALEIHPAEEVIQTYNGNSFIKEKTNYLFILRGMYGREFIFFQKAKKKGIQLSGVASIGPSIGLSPPYYIKYYQENYQNPQSQQIYELVVEAYDPNKHELSNIFSVADPNQFFKSLFTESKIQIGVAMKLGLIFEVNPFLESVMGIEVGVSADTYFNKIQILANKEKIAFFPSIYLNVFFGNRKLLN